jgi:hypothetical protein
MIVETYTSPGVEWNKKIPVSKEYPRHWITTIDLEIVLSDGYILKRPEGTIWDGASIPKKLWWLFKPVDEGAIADFLHDGLWTDKPEQFKRFDYDIHKARLFADNERNQWRKKLTPNKIIKNFITNFVIREIGGLFYSKQLQIPD